VLKAQSSVVAVPVIETERLRLRGHRCSDLADCAAMWSDPTVTKFIGGKPSTVQQTWMRLLSYIGHWSLMGFGYWVIEEKDSNAFVGEIGLADFKRDIAASMTDRPELGFALTPTYHGRGYASEAVGAVLSWADAIPPYRNTVCLINPQNLASVRVAEKCGYVIFEQSAFNDQPVLFLARTSSQQS
jgi:RimJ/RimL family protein N-acetyltransferase